MSNLTYVYLYIFLCLLYFKVNRSFFWLSVVSLTLAGLGTVIGPIILSLSYAKQVWFLYDAIIALIFCFATFFVLKRNESKEDLMICFVLIITCVLTIFVDLVMHYDYVIKGNVGMKSFFSSFSLAMNIMQLILLISPLMLFFVNKIKVLKWKQQ